MQIGYPTLPVASISYYMFIHILGCIKVCILFSFLAPTPPQMFRITSVMATNLSFSWQTPVTLNGVLSGYLLTCQPLLSGIPLPQTLNTAAVMDTLSGLYPGVGYNCSIVARNSAGPSVPVYISDTTLETGIHIHLPYSVLLCFNLHGLQPVNWGHQRAHVFPH